MPIRSELGKYVIEKKIANERNYLQIEGNDVGYNVNIFNGDTFTFNLKHC